MKTENIDLFEHIEALPDEVRQLVLSFSEGDNDYEACKALEKSLKPLGYTFDWGLDAEPFALRRISRLERNGSLDEKRVGLEDLDLSRLDELCSTTRPNRLSPNHGR